jgi:hypothetical protein
MTQFLLGANAGDMVMGPFLDETDGITPETGLAGSITVYRISPAGRAARNSTGTITHLGNGWYMVPLSDVDTAYSTGRMSVTFEGVASGAAPVWHEVVLLDQDWYTSMNGSTGSLRTIVVDIEPEEGETDYLQNLIDAFDGTGYAFTGSSIAADVTAVDGSATAAENLADAYDGATGYSHTLNSYPANVTSINGSTTAAQVMRRAYESPVISTVAAGTPTTTTFPVNLSSAYGTGALIGRICYFTTGDRTGCSQTVSASTSSLITLSAALPGAPGVGDAFIII